MDDNKQDYVMVFEAPKVEPPEFRLYYDEATGDVLFYTCEKPQGKYIIIDNITFACARHDVRVVDGKIIPKMVTSESLHKLITSDTGTKCLVEDLSVVVTEDIASPTKYYRLMVKSNNMVVVM